MTIAFALIQVFEKCAEKSDKAKIIDKACAHKLVTNSSGAVTGLIYEEGGTDLTELGPVFLCSGGSVRTAHRILCSRCTVPL